MGLAPTGLDSISNTILHRFLALTPFKMCRYFRPQRGTVLFISRKHQGRILSRCHRGTYVTIHRPAHVEHDSERLLCIQA